MPRASRNPIKRAISQDLNDNFAFLISSLHNSKEIQQFFEDFLTREEKIMLTKRLMLHLMLENQYTITEIGSVLGISRETIRVHRNIWGRGGIIYKNIIRKIADREKTKEFWQKVERILKPLELVMSSRSDMKARAKLLSGELFDD